MSSNVVQSNEEGEPSPSLHGVTFPQPTSIGRALRLQQPLGNIDGRENQHLGAQVAKAKSPSEPRTAGLTKGFGLEDQSEGPKAHFFQRQLFLQGSTQCPHPTGPSDTTNVSPGAVEDPFPVSQANSCSEPLGSLASRVKVNFSFFFIFGL